MAQYVHPLVDEVYGEYTWCEQCERAHRTFWWALRRWSKCPTPGCQSNGIYSRSWESVRRMCPEYPSRPRRGEIYPLGE